MASAKADLRQEQGYAAYVQSIVATFPPLTSEQRELVTSVLRPVLCARRGLVRHDHLSP